jgi:hypothetical protein
MDKLEICNNIKLKINDMTSNEIEEIFKIIYKNNNYYTKNNNGISLNLNTLDDEILNKINNYINFCIKSHNEINKYEDMCNMLNDSINNKIDDIPLIENINEINKTLAINKQKISSSMKFYLLKKKFQKQQLVSNIESYLTHDEII